MSRTPNTIDTFLRYAPRALLLMLIIAAPVLSIPSVRADEGTTIEAPTMKKSGAGFILMVSLQRS